ncbi:hypothetical protein GQ42DRAFT_178465 [Ramicandelaber brevisporus]|nr:hypothetical protein GQ42DRAFT_178465 [Ramicandelaber brevisporus]
MKLIICIFALLLLSAACANAGRGLGAAGISHYYTCRHTDKACHERGRERYRKDSERQSRVLGKIWKVAQYLPLPGVGAIGTAARVVATAVKAGTKVARAVKAGTKAAKAANKAIKHKKQRRQEKQSPTANRRRRR